MPYKTKGDLIYKEGQLVGSRLIGQKFEEDRYFWPRPSAVDYDAMNSGGSDLGPTSRELKEIIEKRRKSYPEAKDIPSELLTASASGLDPHLTPEAAIFQVKRIAKARNVTEDVIIKLIADYTEGRTLMIFGEPRVNVLLLNLALDQKLGPVSQAEELK